MVCDISPFSWNLYFRIEVLANSSTKFSRIIHLHLLHHSVDVIHKLFPLDKVEKLLPAGLQKALLNVIIDSSFERLHERIHLPLVWIVKVLTDFE